MVYKQRACRSILRKSSSIFSIFCEFESFVRKEVRTIGDAIGEGIGDAIDDALTSCQDAIGDAQHVVLQDMESSEECVTCMVF